MGAKKLKKRATTRAQSTHILKLRKITGFCETCGEKMNTHPRCFYCGILLGDGHESSVSFELRTFLPWCWHCSPRHGSEAAWRCYF